MFSSFSSFGGLSACKISRSHIDWWKFFIHLRNLNISYFGMAETTELKIKASRLPPKL
jgi:hypothetical protein